MCRHFTEDYGSKQELQDFTTFMALWEHLMEKKAPATICRKVIEAKLNKKNLIDVWGDGKQTEVFYL